MTNKTLNIQSERWQKAKTKYVTDLLSFSLDIGYNPSWQELHIFNSIQQGGSRTSVVRGEKCLGLSRAIAVLWHLLFHENSVTFLYVPEIDDVRILPNKIQYWEDLRTEIHACITLIKNSRLAWLAQSVVIGSNKIYIEGHKKTWNVIVKSGQLNPCSLAGSFADSFFLWIDYAGWLSDEYAELLMALMVSVKFRCCLISSPNKNIGFFYHTHHQLSVNCGGKWNAIRLNAEESPYLSQSELNLLLLQNGGRYTAHYKKNVLGEFDHG